MLGQHVHDFDLPLLLSHAPNEVFLALPPRRRSFLASGIGHVQKQPFIAVEFGVSAPRVDVGLRLSRELVEPVRDVLAGVADQRIALFVWR